MSKRKVKPKGKVQRRPRAGAVEGEPTAEVLDVAGAARLLHVPENSIYTMAQRQTIPARKVGRHWRFSRTLLLDWLRTVPAKERTP